MLSACAHPAGTFRLVPGAPDPLLIPPGIREASVTRTSLRVQPGPASSPCTASPSGLSITGKSLTINRDSLIAAGPDELDVWAEAVEARGCIGPAQASRLTARLVDALPLSLAERRQLRGDALATSGSLNLTSFHSLRVVSPILRPGAPPGPAIAAGQSDGGPELKANPDLIGYEIAWYDVRNRSDGPGLQIVARTAEVHIDGKAETHPEPRANPFSGMPAARWFRLFAKTRLSSNDYNIILISAPTASALEARAIAFQQDSPAWLAAANKATYAALANEIEVNPWVRVTIRGTQTWLPLGSSVQQAIASATVPPALSIRKPHDSRLVRVEWDRRTQDILRLTLEGGEEITW